MNNDSTNATDETWLDYDVDESLSHFEWTELAPALVIYFITFCLGLTGWYQSKKKKIIHI